MLEVKTQLYYYIILWL